MSTIQKFDVMGSQVFVNDSILPLLKSWDLWIHVERKTFQICYRLGLSVKGHFKIHRFKKTLAEQIKTCHGPWPLVCKKIAMTTIYLNATISNQKWKFLDVDIRFNARMLKMQYSLALGHCLRCKRFQKQHAPMLERKAVLPILLIYMGHRHWKCIHWSMHIW